MSLGNVYSPPLLLKQSAQCYGPFLVDYPGAPFLAVGDLNAVGNPSMDRYPVGP